MRSWLIKWRGGYRKGFVAQVVKGMSRYPSREAAEKQAAIWRIVFPQNTYYVEPTR